MTDWRKIQLPVTEMLQVISVEPNIDIRLPPSCDVNRSLVCGGHVTRRGVFDLVVRPTTAVAVAVSTESVQQTVK